MSLRTSNTKLAPAHWLATSLIITGFLFAGCNKKPEPPSEAAADQISLTNLQLISETEEHERDQFRAEMRAMALRGDFQKLASLADEFHSKKARFKSGYWKSRAFYLAFSKLPDSAGDPEWTMLIRQLERWTTEQPKSITPRLALVEAYSGYAWKARGSGWANEVKEQGWRLMQDRMNKAFNWLDKARQLPHDDPNFYAMALRLCLGANVNRKDYEKAFESAVQNAPDFSSIYEYKAYYLLPRWNGEQGEWETFARTMTRHNDIPGAKEIYARVVLYLIDLGMFFDEFSEDAKSWEELKASFHALMKSCPDSLEIKSIYCMICTILKDFKEANEQFRELGGKVDLSVWETEAKFRKAVTWVNMNTTKPK